MKSEDISRRSFLKRAAALSAAAAIPSFWIPSKANAMPGVPFVSANEKVRIAFIGIGNRGGEIAQELYKTGLCEVVALCDVDMGAPHTQKLISMFPKVPRFQDFRQMFDKMADKIDAVTVGVPDHDRGNGSWKTCICGKTDGPHLPGNRSDDACRKEIRCRYPDG